MVGTIIPSIYLSIYFFSHVYLNTIDSVREHGFAVLISSKYLVLEFWLRNTIFFSKLIRFPDNTGNNK